MKFTTTEPILGEDRSFVMVSLHMKANGRDSRAKIKRGEETEQLADKIEWLSDELDEGSIVLLGDTNCLGAWETAIEHLESAGFSDLNTEDTPTYAGSSAPFDRIFVHQDRPEFRYSRQYILRSADSDAHERYLSDHYLIKTSIKIYVDDD